VEYVEPLPESSPGLRPITREIVLQVSHGGGSIKNLQYYISAQLTLEIERVLQELAINPQGEGLYREITTRGRIIIDKETGGILRNIYRDAGGFLILEIAFDEDDENRTLFFREHQREPYFSLVYDEASGAVNYGGERYRADFSGEVPWLLVAFREEQFETPEVRRLRGRSVFRDDAGGRQ
jgi:hypothetical protein